MGRKKNRDGQNQPNLSMYVNMYENAPGKPIVLYAD